MSWVDEMHRTAAEIAFPDWEWIDGDEPGLTAYYQRSWSDITPGEPFTFSVEIDRDGKAAASREYTGRAAHEFFLELMRRGSA